MTFSSGLESGTRGSEAGRRRGSKDWGYPRTSRRLRPAVAPLEETLTPGLTAFFDRSKRIPPPALRASRPSRDADAFRSGVNQVEEAVASLRERRRDLERDVTELEVIPLPSLGW